MKKRLQNTGLFILSITICLLFLEILFRLLGPSTEILSKNDSDFIKPDSLLSYRYTPDLDTIITTNDYQIRIKTNSFGFRDKSWSFDTSLTNLLVLGNSFSAGFGINEEQRWSNSINTKLIDSKDSIKVFNAAISGFGITQSVNNGIQLSKLIQPKIIIVGLYLNSLDRIDDPFHYFKGFSVKKSVIPYADVLDNKLYVSFWKINFLKRIEIFFLKNSRLYQFVIETLRYHLAPFLKEIFSPIDSIQNSETNKELSKKAFTELRRLESSVNAKVYLLPIIQHDRNFKIFEDQSEIYNELKILTTNSTISFIDIKPEFETKIEAKVDMWINNDAHWNEIAHAMAAEIVTEYLSFN